MSNNITWPNGLVTGWDLKGTTAAFWPGEEDSYHYCFIAGARCEFNVPLDWLLRLNGDIRVAALIGTRLYIDGGYVYSTEPVFGEVSM